MTTNTPADEMLRLLQEKDRRIAELEAELASMNINFKNCFDSQKQTREQLQQARQELEMSQTDANDWKQGMAGQEERAKDLESKLQEAEAALRDLVLLL